MSSTFPDSAHVERLGLLGAHDRRVWNTARDSGFVLVTKDADFQRFSVMLGLPPKVIWLRLGNGPTAEIARVLLENLETIRTFCADPELAFLALP